jgi:VWFA-related protein
MPSFRRTLTELCAGVILLRAGICQEAPDKTIRIDVNLVQVAIVTDAKGRQVTDLKSEDFEILQDGEPQKITHFSYISTGSSRPAPSAANDSRSVRTTDRDQIRRTIAVVVDDLGLSFESTVRVRDALRKFVKEQMAPGDLVAIIRTSGGMGALE